MAFPFRPAESSVAPYGAKPLVILLHGVNTPPLRMIFAEAHFKKEGFIPITIGYPTNKAKIEVLARYLRRKIQQLVPDDVETLETYIFTHSLGGLVAHELLQQNAIPNATRVVCVTPPFGGSPAADILHKIGILKHIVGPVGEQLTTDYRSQESIPWPEGIDVGIIAAVGGLEAAVLHGIMKSAGVHDGVVSIDSTLVNGADDFATVGTSHSFAIEPALALAVEFFRSGRFNQDQTARPDAENHVYTENAVKRRANRAGGVSQPESKIS